MHLSDKRSAALRRASHRQWVLKPQDFAVALKLVVMGRQPITYHALADIMYLSPFEAHAAVQRLIAARLVVELEPFPQPVISLLRNFVLHGAPYCYPPVRGETTIGFKTAHSVSGFNRQFLESKELPIVWPHREGDARGNALLPLYKELPLAAVRDQDFYSLLALFDVLRVGQARERELATSLLKEKLA